jgi:hypothetical protein
MIKKMEPYGFKQSGTAFTRLCAVGAEEFLFKLLGGIL